MKRQRPQTTLGLELFHPLPELAPLIERVVAEGPGLVVVAGLDPRVEADARASDAGKSFVPSGRSTLLKSLVREMSARHPGRVIVITRDRDVVRISRQPRSRVELVLLEPGELYAPRISSVLRYAPALLVIDQLDAESAPAALDAGRAGLRVLSQIETVFKGADVVRHLVDLGVSREQLAGLTWIVSVQRMATLCPHCKQHVFLDSHSLDALYRRYPRLSSSVTETNPFCEAPGCANCQETGRKGYVTCFDVFQADAVYPALLDQASLLSMEDYGLRLALQGSLSVRDVLHFERDQLLRTYNLFALSERALAETNATLRRKVLELETANRVLQQRTEALVSLHDIGQALITGAGGDSASELYGLAHRVCRHTHDLCGADRAVLYLVRPEGAVEVLAVNGWDARLVGRQVDAALAMPGMERVGVAEPRRFVQLPPGVQQQDARGVYLQTGLCVPLVAQQELVGWLIVHTTRGSPFSPGEVALLQTYANQAAVAIQRAGLVESLWNKIEQLEAAQEQLAQKERLVRELELARQVQQSLLPRTFPRVPGYTFAALNEPARQVGGDFYDVIHLDDEHFGVAVADVSDKGMPAAVYMALTRSLLLAEARRDLSPCAVLSNVNRLLLELGAPGPGVAPSFVSVFYGVVEAATRQLTYTRAGHDRPLLLRGGDALPLQGQGTVLGILGASELRLSEEQVVLAPEDRLVLYTDGLTDVVAPDDHMFSLVRLKALLQSCAGSPADELCRVIFERLGAFRGAAEQYDDMTMLVVQVARS